LGKSPVLHKVQALEATDAFSHFRAISIAASALADPELAVALFNLLQKPGIQGHAVTDTATAIRNVNTDLNETEARNVSLRELLLGRGLYLCGDCNGLGRRILEAYSNDLRGHYARHAQAVLDCPDIITLRKEVW
jgi:hypothetical protein